MYSNVLGSIWNSCNRFFQIKFLSLLLLHHFMSHFYCLCFPGFVFLFHRAEVLHIILYLLKIIKHQIITFISSLYVRWGVNMRLWKRLKWFSLAAMERKKLNKPEQRIIHFLWIFVLLREKEMFCTHHSVEDFQYWKKI